MPLNILVIPPIVGLLIVIGVGLKAAVGQQIVVDRLGDRKLLSVRWALTLWVNHGDARRTWRIQRAAGNGSDQLGAIDELSRAINSIPLHHRIFAEVGAVDL